MGNALTEHRLVLFGGQGSPSIFSANAATIAEQDARSISAGNILLSKCHAAFLEEIASLDPESRHSLAVNLSLFSSPGDLLKPAVQYHTHPVLQATTIYLCQLLRYLAETLGQYEAYKHSFDTLQVTAGFSSGILPAAVVARSRTLSEFVASGVQGFRLAFWIACRSLLWTLKTTGKVSDEGGEKVDSEATLSLITRGLSRDQIEQRLSHHYSQGYGLGQLPQSQQRPRRMEVSAISISGTVSISGPKADLCAFQAQLQTITGLTTTYAYVHGWYHGGDQLEAVVQQVLQDLSRRAISFPLCSTGTKPIYSTLDGTLFGESTTSADEFLAWITRHLLVHCVDWCHTAHEIVATVQSLLERKPGAAVKILSFGPSSSSLFPNFEPLDPRVTLLDLSPFKAGGKSESLSSHHQNDVAIVGMSVQLPKGKGTEELWETISQGLNAVQEIPENRFELRDLYAENSDKPRSMPIRHGAFLEDPFAFDNLFFNLSPREAKSMDPQQRVLLHAAQEAFEDAGYVEDSSPSFQRATMGCYIGLATGDYTDNLRNDIDTFYSSGTLRAFHSGRISYFFRLSGPSIVTDTACSSSAVSIYQACRALQNGDCTAAIAGGVNVITSPDMYLGLARGHFLSRTGSCKPFDAAADGYCRAEGCALFVLKRLSDAVAEGDRIHGVIRNILVNQSGNSHSITHPHSQTQTDLLTRLLQQADVDPGSVGVVEAHGTGTQAGDAREVETLRAVFGPHHSATNPLMMSSIKGNVGHCEAASGAAGLAKLLLMLRERKIPLQAGLNNINPAFGNLQGSGLSIPRRTVSWSHSQRTPRRAVLNNFGAAGSNASLLLEDWVESPKARMQRSKQDQDPGRSAYLFALSARSERTLQSAISRHVEFLGKEERRPSLVDICYTATARRHPHDHRISLACTSVADLLTRLQKYKAVASKPVRGITVTVFVFTGQGAVYHGMGQELMRTFPPFRDSIMSCDRIIQGLRLVSPSIVDFILYEDQSRIRIDALTEMEQIIASQCACVALEYALARTFMSWGITPDYVMGHSLGEYTALCVSGALTLEDTFRVVASRAKMMADNCLANTSGMLACNLAPEKVEAMLSENPAQAQLTMACLNGPNDCVVGGPLTQLDMLQKDCKVRKVRSKLINVPYAFHTSAMDPILEPLRALGRSVRFRQPTIPVMSNLHGRLLRNDDFSSDYFAHHARQPVRFADCLLSLQLLVGKPILDDALFLEIGPQPTLLPMLQASISSSSCTYLRTLQKGQDAWTSISETLAAISLRKTAVKWREVFTGTSAKVTSLPGHLLEGSNFLIPFRESLQTYASRPDALGRIESGFRLLPWLSSSSRCASEELFLETDMTILGSLISGHDVGGTPICPASVFYELVLEAAQTLLKPPETQVLVVSEMSFASPLVHVPSSSSQDAVPVTVGVGITRQGSSPSTAAAFTITSRSSAKDSAETLHCTGSVSMQSMKAKTSHWVRDQAVVARQSRYFSDIGKNHMSTFRTKVLYEAVFTRVVRYSPEYQSLVYLNVADSNLEGIGSFEMPSGSGSHTGYLAHPVFTDTLLHAAGFIANLAGGSGDIRICARVESIEIAYRDIDYSDSFIIYCSLLEINGAILADAIALASSGKVVAVVRGIEFKKLQVSTFQQALSRISSTLVIGSPSGEYVQHLTAAPVKPHPKPSLDDFLTSDEMASSSLAEPPSRDSPFQAARISRVLEDIVVEVGGFAEQDIDYTKPLGDLGIDSLMQIEIASRLARLFPGQTGLSHHALSQCETLEAIDDLLSSVLQPSAKQQQLHRTLVDIPASDTTNTPESSCRSTGAAASVSSDYSSPSITIHDPNILPVTLHVSAGHQVPLCLFHDGSGQVGMYARLGGHDRTTYAFFDPYFKSSGNKRLFHNSINQMADHYVSTILSNPKHRSSSLILAFEAAQQLTIRGLEVKGLVLIDSPNPIGHEPLPAAVISSITKPSGQYERLAWGSSAALEEEFQSNASLLGAYNPESFPNATGRKMTTVMLRSQDVLDTECLYGVCYDWLSRQDARDASVVAWEDLVGGHVEVFPIPGNHFEPFLDNNIGETAAQVWKACRYIEEFCEFDS
ncbi:hypothetical protein EDB81DRAFT_899181 [Dactylonectria macrodidyma]|uniref:Polyketide synthase n=1 Tax=Dactylonectria macrodidyma TaxID=307937 RepID=A0A9P9EQ09_9HYPO|nr:hypothetical protein EDB81DRAFT_899181 [Dactylonectria macrodidyma]